VRKEQQAGVASKEYEFGKWEWREPTGDNGSKEKPPPLNVAATGGMPMQSDSVYRVIDVVGVSETSWEDAGIKAVETAAGSLRDLRVAEVTKMDMKVDNGKVTAFRTRVALSFKYETD
jgi:dodecin